MKKLKSLKTNLFSRNSLFLGIATRLGKDFLFSDKDGNFEKIVEALGNRVEFLTDELGEIKGSFLKAGQMLSLYAGDLLPPELVKVLEKLQGQTSYLEWKIISKNIPENVLKDLKIEEDAFAAASIGQVHKAILPSGENAAIKIQYKNIENLIDTDLRFIRILINLMKVIPQDVKLDKVFDEIKVMLLKEMDYEKEAVSMKRFRELAGKEYIIPKLYEEYSSRKVICMEYIDGQNVDDGLKTLSLDDKARLAKEFFNLFLNEIFKWKLTQSDAHMGNYLLKDGKWVLLDFGATKELSDELALRYQDLIRAFFKRDIELVIKLIEDQGAIDTERSDMDYFREYCQIIFEPLGNEEYDWANSDVASRLMKMVDRTTTKIKFNFLPHENIFIDRKIVGVYYMLKKIGAKINLAQNFVEYID
ncbi:MAG: AarF/ABC1/UbiB kinase family protein [Oligoflexia bacterium]|nr:AarF/ABC1/UbiB kinase family protein [Oligoflexia bacterium]